LQKTGPERRRRAANEGRKKTKTRRVKRKSRARDKSGPGLREAFSWQGLGAEAQKDHRGIDKKGGQQKMEMTRKGIFEELKKGQLAEKGGQFFKTKEKRSPRETLERILSAERIINDAWLPSRG